MDFVELAMLQRRRESLSFHGDTAWTADERGERRVLRGGLRGQVAASAGSAGVTCVHSALRRIGAGARAGAPDRRPSVAVRPRGVVNGVRWHEDHRTR